MAVAMAHAAQHETTDTLATNSRDVLANVRAVWPTVLSWAVLFVFTALYSIFIGWVLLRGNPYVGETLFDASTVNLLLSIFSQFYGMLLCFVIVSLLENWRWMAVTREDSRNGISALAFMQLSPGAGFFTTLLTTLQSPLKRPIGLIKYE